MLLLATRFFLASILVLAIGANAYGQSCAAVYKDSTRNIDFIDSNFAALNVLFDEYCSSSENLNKRSLDTAGEAFAGYYKGNLKSDSLKQNVEKFCRDYKDIRYSEAGSKIRKSHVVTEALSNFNSCIDIENRHGVTITHKHAENAIVFNFAFKGSVTKFALEGVKPSSNMNCFISTPPKNARSFSPKKPINTTTRLEYDSNFSMICERNPVALPDGSANFQPGSVAIATNLAPYVVSLAADTIYADHLASATTLIIANLKSTLEQSEATKKSLTAERDALKKRRAEPFMAVIGQYNPGGRGQHFGCGTAPQQVVDSICRGAVSSTINQFGSEAGHQCGYAYFLGSCVFPQ